jgi:hypothetical protein
MTLLNYMCLDQFFEREKRGGKSLLNPLFASPQIGDIWREGEESSFNIY